MARITKKERSEIARLRRNAQAKIRRNVAKGVDPNMMPPVPKITAQNTRQEINALKAQLKDFLNPANLDYQYVVNYLGLTFTKRQANQVKRAQNAANRMAEKERTKYDDEVYRIISEEKQNIRPTARTVGQDRIKEKSRPFTRSIDSFKSFDEFAKYFEKIQMYSDPRFYTQRNIRYKENFIAALQNVFGDDAVHIVYKVENMPLETFVRLTHTTDILNFNYVYSPEEYQDKLSYIESVIFPGGID